MVEHLCSVLFTTPTTLIDLIVKVRGSFFLCESFYGQSGNIHTFFFSFALLISSNLSKK